jgi:hypothetical protein
MQRAAPCLCIQAQWRGAGWREGCSAMVSGRYSYQVPHIDWFFNLKKFKNIQETLDRNQHFNKFASGQWPLPNFKMMNLFENVSGYWMDELIPSFLYRSSGDRRCN